MEGAGVEGDGEATGGVEFVGDDAVVEVGERGEHVGREGGSAIEGVVEDGPAAGAELDADLVHASGEERDF